MEENNYCHIYKYIDQKPMLGNWEIDTVVFFLTGIFMGVMSGGYIGLTCITLGFIGAWVNIKIKKMKYRNYSKHILYMIGLYQPKTDRLPKSYMRYFLS